MYWFKKRKSFYQSNLLLILLFLILIAILLRMALPSIIAGVANKKISERSPYFSFHIDDIDLKIIRGKYVVQGLKGHLKSNGKEFLNIDSVTADVSWRNLFKGKIVTDILVDQLHLTASQKLIDAFKQEAIRMKKEDSQKESNIRVGTFRLKDSSITIENLSSLRGAEKRKITNINFLATNLNPTEGRPNTDFNLTAKIFGPAPFKIDGVAKLNESPIAWDANIELKNFDLTSLNPFVREKVNTYIKRGRMDDYAEVKASKGVIKGYTKPFLSKFKMDEPKDGFNFTGEAAEKGSDLVKILLTDSEAKTLATKVPFTFKDKFEYDILPALTLAVVHKAKQNIKPGLENTIELDTSVPKQAQEAKE